MKRVIACILLAAMLLGLVSVAAFADAANTMVWTASIGDGSDEHLPEQGFWGQYSVRRMDVRSITFQDTTAGAPEHVWNLSAAWDKSVIGWYRNGDLVVAADGKISLHPNCMYLFAGMTSCTEINFNHAVDTSNVKNMTSMFRGCTMLKNLDLSCFDTSNVTDMSCMFYGCKRLESVDVSSFNTEKVTTMQGMFTSCRSMEALDLSAFKTPALTDMKAMFDTCAKLKEVNLSNFDTSNVVNMQNLFGGCRALESANLNNFKTENVVYMSNLFANCTSLKKVEMNGFSTAKVRGMAQMFLNVGELSEFQCSDEAIQKAYESRNYC